MSESQIILVPHENYYQWVEAAKEYALKYGVNLTWDPDTVGRLMLSDLIATIANAPNAYPEQGDVAEWFARTYPHVRLDLIKSGTPEEFQRALAARVAADDRYGMAGKPFVMRWPTDYSLITQRFGANPDIYRRWGLPGHEGLDIRAPIGANIYACADGKVIRIDTYAGDPRTQPYGNSVRLQHRDGYVTVYAHFQQIHVKLGDLVRAGQVLGLADSTGNSTGSHLHLTLKKQGATAGGQTIYPNDIIDPTPYLIPPADAPPVIYPWPAGRCLVGVHGRADGPLQEPDLEAVRVSRVEAVKLSSTARPEDIDRLKAIRPSMLILLRLFADFRNRVVRSDEFATWLENDLAQFYGRGVRYVEVHNEPNLQVEGWTFSWQDGKEFAAWFLDVRRRLQAKFPDLKLGFPGLSPGPAISGQRADAITFLQQADEAVRASDWVGVHCYWQDEAEMNNAAIGGRFYEQVRRRYPDKLLFVTEFSNPSHGVDLAVKAQQYLAYYQSLRGLPGIGAAIAFLLSASSYFPSEVWRGEDGRLTPIPGVIGGRGFA